jgi:hypothetical protein
MRPQSVRLEESFKDDELLLLKVLQKQSDYDTNSNFQGLNSRITRSFSGELLDNSR